MADKLKHPNLPLLAGVMGANLALFALLLTTNKLVFDSGALAREWRSLVPAGVAVVLASVLSAQLGASLKARLVFLRWRYPLPGCRAFSEIGPGDHRVDMQRLKAKLKTLPSEPADQNSTWYSLYRVLKGDPAVIQAHQAFLDHRDCTALVGLLIIPLVAVAAFYVRAPAPVVMFAFIMTVELLVFRRAAATRGRDFVATVLAISSAGH